MLTPERIATELKKLFLMFSLHNPFMTAEFEKIDFLAMINSVKIEDDPWSGQASIVLEPITKILHRYNCSAIAGLLASGDENLMKNAVLRIFMGAASNNKNYAESALFSRMLFRFRNYHEEPEIDSINRLLRKMGIEFETEEEARDKDFRRWAGSSSPAWDEGDPDFDDKHQGLTDPPKGGA